MEMWKVIKKHENKLYTLAYFRHFSDAQDYVRVANDINIWATRAVVEEKEVDK